jgi:N-acetylneuraminic acid mutarotase
MKHILHLLIPILALLLLAACSTDAPTPTPVLQPTVAPPPTDTPTPTNTSAPTDTPQPPTDTLAPADTPAPPTKTPMPSPTPLSYPVARFLPHLVYNSKTNQAFITYGYQYRPSSGEKVLFDTWAFDPQSLAWKPMQKRPFPTCYYVEGSVYDSVADQVIVFCSGNNRSIMAYDANTNAWSMLDDANTPYRSLPQIAYDSESDKTILFGGYDGNQAKVFDETWAFDSKTNTWTKMEPAVHPPAMMGIDMAYDAESDRVILWGGYIFKGDMINDWSADPAENLVWAYDYNTNTWEQLSVNNGPAIPEWVSDLEQIAMTYAPDMDRVFVYADDLFYTYDYNTNHWEQAKGDLIKAGPGRRMMQGMVYLPTIQRLMVFGGSRVPVDVNSSENFMDDTWLYDPQTGEWTQVGP